MRSLLFVRAILRINAFTIMATQHIDEKELTSEHVEQVAEKKENSDRLSSDNGEHVDALKHAEQGDKFHAMRIDGDDEDHMYVLIINT